MTEKKIVRARNFCFTHNNYPNTDLEDNLPCRYICYGREIGESGTPHLQGFVSFVNAKTLKQVIAMMPGCHIEVAKTVAAAINYCSKDGQFTERGERPQTQQEKGMVGKAREIERWQDALEHARCGNFEAIPADIYIRYRSTIHAIHRDMQCAPPVQPHALRDWQAELNEMLNREPDDRKVIFVVDANGSAGKTWFSQYYSNNHPNCQIIGSGKYDAMAYMLKLDNRVLFINCPRSQNEYLAYGFLEAVKDRMVNCPKYESQMKMLERQCHVVVMMNQEPDENALSKDRYIRIRIK